jgi:hypothetical protein
VLESVGVAALTAAPFRHVGFSMAGVAV